MKKGLGVNLIVNKSNIKLEKQLESCLKLEIDFIITSLGNPKKVIQQAKEKNIKVFCDVIEENYAKKVETDNVSEFLCIILYII